VFTLTLGVFRMFLLTTRKDSGNVTKLQQALISATHNSFKAIKIIKRIKERQNTSFNLTHTYLIIIIVTVKNIMWRSLFFFTYKRAGCFYDDC